MRMTCASGVVAIAYAAMILVNAAREARAGWVWTPETGWMNAKQTPKPTAEEQLGEGKALYEKERYAEAGAAFSMVHRFYPDSRCAEEADFLEAVCLYRVEYHSGAYKRLEEFLKNFPDSERRAEAIELEIKVGEDFLRGAKKRILGMKLLPARETGIKIIEAAIAHDPFHARAPEALMTLGDARFEIKQFEEAKKYFARVVGEYPKSERRQEAEYKMVLCDEESVPDTDYDTSSFRKVEKRYKRLAVIGGDEVGGDAGRQADVVREKRARKEFDTAEFYRKTGKTGAALVYYRAVTKDFAGTQWAEKANQWIEELAAR